MSTIFTILIALLVFGFLILIHEFGHYIFARLFKVTVFEFSIGMGPRIFTHTSKKSGIKYSLAALPIGGFVSMAGEDGEEDINPDAPPEVYEGTEPLNRKAWWKRLIILVAGASMNIVVGIVVMFLLVASTKGLLATNVIHSFADPAETGYEVSSADSGLMEGDVIVEVGGTKIHTANELSYEVMRKGTEAVEVVVLRDGEYITLDVIFPTVVSDGILFGTLDFYVYGEEKSFTGVVKHAFFRSFSTIKMIWESLFDLVTGRYGVEAVSGPVGVTSAIGEAAQTGISNLIYLAVVISMNLGVVNLLPFPALDGGRVVMILIELVRGKPIPAKYEAYINFAGIVILFGFMIAITIKDVISLFGG